MHHFEGNSQLVFWGRFQIPSIGPTILRLLRKQRGWFFLQFECSFNLYVCLRIRATYDGPMTSLPQSDAHMVGELNVVQLFLSAGIQEFVWWLMMSL